VDVAVLLVGWGWTYDQIRTGWMQVEELDYDICYLGDDLFAHQDDADVAVFEPWTLLPAMAATTKRMRIGSLVSPVGRRHPGLFAKMTTNVDLISGGRLIVGRGLGNAPEQQASLGQPYPPPSERTAMLREELVIMRSLWTEGRCTFEGEHYDLTNALCNPRPISEPHPEVLLAFASPKFLPPLAAEFATRVNLLGADDEKVKRALRALAESCESLGRDPAELVAGRLASIVLTEEEVPPEARDEALAARARQIGVEPDRLISEHNRVLSYVGPPGRCADDLRARTVDLGVDELVLCIDTIDMNGFEPFMKGLEIFAREVLPQLTAA
jgi:alkanesulfonate monooxygenase SsuD/methylene tetrahydromethanopterin reductase-like flavin-dependent oxidoreductase (luciferase family)